MDTAALAPRALTIAARGAVAGWFGAIVLGVFLPVYTDEVGWRFQLRAGFDGVDKMYSDLCGANTLARPPPFMWPARWWSAAWNALLPEPLFVRLAGVAYALAWGVLLLALIRRIAPRGTERRALGAIGFALLTLGTTPLIMVMSRPEQPLILAALGAVLLALPRAGEPGLTIAPIAWRRSLALLTLALIALSYHLKALLLTPLFVVALLLASRGRAAVAPRLAAAGALATATVSAGFYWANRLRCPGDRLLRAEYARNSAGEALVEPQAWFDMSRRTAGLWRNMNPVELVKLARPENAPLSDWLPAGQLSAAASERWGWALVAGWSLALVPALATLVLALAARSDRRPALASALLVAVFGWSATRLVQNFYEAAFVLPLLASAVLLLLSVSRWRALTRLVALILAPAALVSLAVSVATWWPALAGAWRGGGYLDRQPHSLGLTGYAPLRRDALAAGRSCGIPAPARATGVMVDDATYFAFMTSHLPQHQLGVVGQWRGTIGDPIGYLNSRRSDGIVVGCHLLPPALRARARKVGAVCCLAPPGW